MTDSTNELIEGGSIVSFFSSGVIVLEAFFFFC